MLVPVCVCVVSEQPDVKVYSVKVCILNLAYSKLVKSVLVPLQNMTNAALLFAILVIFIKFSCTCFDLCLINHSKSPNHLMT